MNKKKLIWQLPFLILLIVGTVLIIRQQQSLPYYQNEGFVFGTSYHISYQCDSDLHQYIKDELQKVDMSLSPFNEKSIITAINQNRDVEPDAMFLDVFRKAMTISQDTEGAFDITVAPLVNAWGFGFKNGSQPDKSQVDSLLWLVGYQKVALKDGRIVKQHPDIMLDCSAIAKGYGSDVVARFLRRKGIKNFMVEIAAEHTQCGRHGDGHEWQLSQLLLQGRQKVCAYHRPENGLSCAALLTLCDSPGKRLCYCRCLRHLIYGARYREITKNSGAAS